MKKGHVLMKKGSDLLKRVLTHFRKVPDLLKIDLILKRFGLNMKRAPDLTR